MHISFTLRDVFTTPDFMNFINSHMYLLIKPNLCSTHLPAVTPLKTVQEIILHLNHQVPHAEYSVMLIESDQTIYSLETKLAETGYDKLPTKVINAKDFWRNLSLQEAFRTNKLGFINLPIIKASDMPNIHMSCAVKNLFGLIASPKKASLHKHLPQVLRSLHSKLKDYVYTIVDGSRCMEGNGSPIHGDIVVFPQFYIHGLNLMEIDNYVCNTIMGFPLPSYLDSVTISNEPPFSHPKFGHFRPSVMKPIRKLVLQSFNDDSDGKIISFLRGVKERWLKQ